MFQILTRSLLIIGLCLTTQALHAEDAEVWSVLSDPKLAAVSDLLTVTLSQEDIELVERDQLVEATREMSLVALSGGDPKDRLQLGKLVGADFLLLLRKITAEKAEALQVLACDCKTGARLMEQVISFDDQRPDAAAESVAKVVRLVRVQYPEGVTRLVGVAPFLCRNLTHENDHYQFALSSLITRGLQLHKGLAAVEIAEARAIGDELARAGGAVSDRIVPLLIEGEFRTKSEPGQKPVFQISVRVNGGGGVRESNFDPVPLLQLDAFCFKQLPQFILPNTDEAAAFSADEQFDWLRSRAKEFSDFRLFDQARALNEAALILRPDDGALRRSVMSSYLYASGQSTGLPPRSEYAKGIPEEAKRRVSQWFAAASHFEYLVRNRLTSGNEAASAARALADRPYFMNGIAFGAEQETPVGRECREFIAQFEGDLRTLLWSTYPLILELDWSRYGKYRFVNSQNGVVDEALQPYAGSETLPECLQVMIQVSDKLLAKEAPPADQLIRLMQTYATPPRDPRATTVHDFISPAEWVDFLNAMARLDAPHAQFAGRCGLVLWNTELLRTKDGATPEEFEALSAEASALIAMYQRHWPEQLENKRMPADLDQLAYKLKSEAIASTAPDGPRRPVPVVRPEVPATPERLSIKPSTEYVPAQLIFESVGLEVPKVNGVGFQFLVRHTPCGDHFDLLSDSRIYFVLKDGRSYASWHDTNGRDSTKLGWDGTHLWGAPSRDEIWVRELDGRVVAQAGTADGLPPGASLFHPLAPGKMLVAGSLDNGTRGWIAIMERLGNRLAIKMIHEGTRAITENSPYPTLETGFDPAWAADFLSDDGGRRVLIGVSNNGKFGLCVDPVSGITELWPVQMGSYFGQGRNGPVLVAPSQTGPAGVFTVIERSDGFRRLDLLEAHRELVLNAEGNRVDRRLGPAIVYRGFAYVGSGWINLRTGVKQEIKIVGLSRPQMGLGSLIFVDSMGRLISMPRAQNGEWTILAARYVPAVGTPPIESSSDHLGLPETYTLSPEEEQKFTDLARTFYDRGDALPEGSIATYCRGAMEVDDLFYVPAADLYFEPEKKPEGYQLHYHNGRLVRTLMLNQFLTMCYIWYDDQGRPAAVASYYSERLSAISVLEYDKNNRLIRAVRSKIDQDGNISVYGSTLFRYGAHPGEFSYCLYYKSGTRSRVYQELADGQATTEDASNTAGKVTRQSYRQHWLIAPTRYGLEPVYPSHR